MDHDTFVTVFAGVFEESPWAAEQTWKHSPFESVESFIKLMCQSVNDADRDTKMALLCAHPELGTNKKMALNSEKEQTAAGIWQRSSEQLTSLAELNKHYREKFGFPYIIAVKGLTIDLILENMQSRLDNDTESEFDECLQQVFRIAHFRMNDLLVKD